VLKANPVCNHRTERGN